MDKFIEVGKIVKPQGIKGEVKVLPYVDRPQGFTLIRNIFLDGKSYSVIGARIAPDGVYLRLENVADRNAAEELRGAELTVEREKADVFKDGDFFVDDLIGLKVTVDGKVLGEVSDVDNFGTADVIYVSGERPFSFPYIKQFVVPDTIAGTITIDTSEFPKIALYDDD